MPIFRDAIFVQSSQSPTDFPKSRLHKSRKAAEQTVLLNCKMSAVAMS